jgi:hypothetical protein
MYTANLSHTAPLQNQRKSLRKQVAGFLRAFRNRQTLATGSTHELMEMAAPLRPFSSHNVYDTHDERITAGLYK